MSSDRRRTPLARYTSHACPRPVRLAVLARARYFTGLSAAELDAVDARMVVRAYPEGGPIYRDGEAAEGLHILATGRVKLVRPALGDGEVLVDVVTPGTLFGDVAATGGSAYTDTATALTESCTLWISSADFRRLLREHPVVAMAVLDDVTARLEEAHQTVRRLSGGTVEQRVAATLLTLADKVGEPRDGAVLLQIPLSRGDLAAMTGTTTESVSRVLSRLHKDGLVDTGRRWTAITDRGGLARLASAET